VTRGEKSRRAPLISITIVEAVMVWRISMGHDVIQCPNEVA
jgi:hypothetical protein